MINTELTPEAGIRLHNQRSWTWMVIAATGLVVAATGLSNIVVHWLPPRIHNDQWRYMVSGSTIDGFSGVTLGVVALFSGLYGFGNPAWLRLFSWLNAALTVAVGLVYVSFLTTLPRIHKLAETAADADTVRAGVTRTSVASTLMFLLLAGLSLAAWRKAASYKKAGT